MASKLARSHRYDGDDVLELNAVVEFSCRQPDGAVVGVQPIDGHLASPTTALAVVAVPQAR